MSRGNRPIFLVFYFHYFLCMAGGCIFYWSESPEFEPCRWNFCFFFCFFFVSFFSFFVFFLFFFSFFFICLFLCCCYFVCFSLEIFSFQIKHIKCSQGTPATSGWLRFGHSTRWHSDERPHKALIRHKKHGERWAKNSPLLFYYVSWPHNRKIAGVWLKTRPTPQIKTGPQ